MVICFGTEVMKSEEGTVSGSLPPIYVSEYYYFVVTYALHPWHPFSFVDFDRVYLYECGSVSWVLILFAFCKEIICQKF